MKICNKDIIKTIILTIIALSIVTGSLFLISAFPVYVKPLDSTNLQPNTNFNYQFVFSKNNDCSGAVYTSNILTIATGQDGIGFVDLDISNITDIPNYLCEYRGNPLSLRKILTLSDLTQRKIFGFSGNFSGNLSSDYIHAKINANNIIGNVSVFNITYDAHINNLTLHNSTFNYNHTAIINPKLYWNLSGNNLFLSDPSYNVQIGTTTPSYQNLHIAGVAGITTSDNAAGLVIGNATKDWTLHPVGGNLNFFEYTTIFNEAGGNDRVTFAVGGNVGIGALIPTQKLDVRGSANFSGTVYINNATDISIWAYNQTSPILSKLYWNLSGTNLFTSASNYNVGIGTTAPTQALQVHGTILSNSTDGEGITLDSTANNVNVIQRWKQMTSEKGAVFYLNSDKSFHVRSASNLSLDVNGAVVPSLFVTTGGNIGIGTINPLFKLDVNGALKTTQLLLGGITGMNVNFSGNISTTLSISQLNNITLDIGNNYSIYDENLVLMYNFNNISGLGESDTKVVDLSSYSYNGTPTINATVIPSGKYGGAYNFSGDASWINTNYLPANGSKTISAWINQRSIRAGLSSYFISNFNAVGGTSGNRGIGFRTFGNNIICTSANSTGAAISAQTGVIFSANTWTHVVCNYDNSNGNLTIFVNGAFSPTANATIYGGDRIDNGNYTIGRLSTTNTNNALMFNGTIDEVRAWNRSLTAGEINTLYKINLNKYNSNSWNFTITDTSLLPEGRNNASLYSKNLTNTITNSLLYIINYNPYNITSNVICNGTFISQSGVIKNTNDLAVCGNVEIGGDLFLNKLWSKVSSGSWSKAKDTYGTTDLQIVKDLHENKVTEATSEILTKPNENTYINTGEAVKQIWGTILEQQEEIKSLKDELCALKPKGYSWC